VDTTTSDLDFPAMLDAMTIAPSPTRNSIVTGEVVLQAKDGIFVNIGLKCDAFVPADQADNLTVGEVAQFYVTQEAEDYDDIVTLSRTRLRRWLDMQQLRDSSTSTAALVESVARAKGGNVAGLNVNVGGLRGFVPRSELAVFGSLDKLVADKASVPVKVLEADPAKGRHGELILSHKRAIEEVQDQFLASLAEGTVVPGTVAKVLDHEVGVLVVLDPDGYVTGLTHKSELSDDRKAKCGDIVKVGDPVNVKVLRVDLTNRKVSLSLKQAAQQQVMDTLKEDDVVTGLVARFVDYGVFVDLGGIDGLLHLSEIPAVKGVKEKYEAGQAIPVKIIGIDKTRNRVALSRKNLSEKA
jgi:small subunit ribosomal protein S1